MGGGRGHALCRRCLWWGWGRLGSEWGGVEEVVVLLRPWGHVGGVRGGVEAEGVVIGASLPLAMRLRVTAGTIPIDVVVFVVSVVPGAIGADTGTAASMGLLLIV